MEHTQIDAGKALRKKGNHFHGRDGTRWTFREFVGRCFSRHSKKRERRAIVAGFLLVFAGIAETAGWQNGGFCGATADGGRDSCLLYTSREEVLEANLELVRRGLVLYTFGNASGIARDQGLVVIKPSGVAYESMKPEHLVIVDLSGRVVEGALRPSSDLATHLILYRAFTEIGGVAHTHSQAATSWAQAQREIPCFGTTHADYFRGSVPVTEALSAEEVESDYEVNTGHAIVRRFKELDPMEAPAVLVASHLSLIHI